MFHETKNNRYPESQTQDSTLNQRLRSQYEQRTYLKYGNNTETFYNYTPSLRRLQNMVVKNPASVDLINDTYAYDKTGNILSLTNAALPVSNMGGATTNTYSYDALNRLQTASGSFTGNLAATPDNRSQYSLAMTYSNTGKINTKVQSHSKNGVNVTANTYNNTYNYVSGSHKLSTITNGSTDYFGYDRNGNMSSWYRYSTPTALYWDEANRLRVVLSNYGSTLQHYIYDASGDRVLKARSTSTALYANGTLVNSSTTMDNYTTYPSGLLVVSPTGIYSKHYYIGSQRIASRVGDGTATIFEGGGLKSSETETSTSELDALKLRQQQDLLYYASKAGIKTLEYAPYETPNLSELTEESTLKSATAVPTYAIYYYHPDHLGSNTLITNTTGVPYQLFLNLPFGETMAEQTTSTGTYQNPYKFNGKELDAETGLYYYGARYYDPKSSVWLSVDPLADKNPGWTPYRFGFNNPIRYNDPDGQWEWDKVGNLTAQRRDNSYSLAKFLGTNQKNALTMLNRGGYTVNNKGVLNLKVGNQLSKNDLWVGTKSASGPVVNNTKEATNHYFNGNGQAADVGDQSTRELLGSSKFQTKHQKIISENVDPIGYFSVDMTKSTFHIGNTGVDYNISNNGNASAVTYTLFTNTDKNSPNKSDGFWDPDFIDEWSGMQKADELGPNLERFGGTPYPYKTRERTYFYKPVEE